MAIRDAMLKNVGQNWGHYSLSTPKLQPYIDDKEIVMVSVNYRPLDYKYASPRLKNDKDVAMSLAKNENRIADVQLIFEQYFPQKFKTDMDIVNIILSKNCKIYTMLPDILKNNKLIVVEAITKSGNLYAKIPAIFRSDKSILIIALITCDIHVIFEYIPEEIKNDLIMGEKIIRKSPPLIKKMPQIFFRNNKLVDYVVSNKVNGIYEHLTDEQKNNKQLIINIICQITNCTELRNIYDALPSQLKHDDDIVKIAINTSGYYLKHGSDIFKNSPTHVITAINTQPDALAYASNKIQNDYNLISYLLLINVNIYEFICDEFKDDDELASIMCSRKASLLKYSSNRIKNNKCLIRIAVSNDPDSFQHASTELKCNKQYIERLTMLESNNKIMTHMSHDLLNDEEFMLTKIKLNSDSLVHISTQLRNNVDFALKVITIYPNKYKHFASEVQNKTKFILHVYKNASELDKITFLRTVKSHGPSQHICLKYLTQITQIQTTDSTILMDAFV